MYLRLQKIDHAENTWRWYVLSVQQLLFGEWAVIREWGRLGDDSGQTLTTYFTTLPEALEACNAAKSERRNEAMLHCRSN